MQDLPLQCISVIYAKLKRIANFRYHGNKSQYLVNFNNIVQLHDIQNPVWCINVLLYLLHKARYGYFSAKIPKYL